jgi:integrase
MASVHRVERAPRNGRARRAWQVRYRDPDRVMRARTFDKKIEAERFAASVETDKARGEYVDPRAGKVTVTQWSGDWIATTKHLKPKTREGYESLLRRHILPRFGTKALSAVRPVDVKRFIADLSDQGLSPSRLRQVRHLLGMLFKAAVDNGSLARSPIVGVKVPRDRRREMKPLTADQVKALAANVPDRYRALVLLLAYGGVRWGEAAALRRHRVNLLRGRIEIVEAVSEVRGELHYGSTKTYATRSVAIPGFLRDALGAHIKDYVPDPEGLMFTTENGNPLRLSNFRQRVWWPALDSAGIPRSVRIHDLRHTCASLLIARGANAKLIQAHLGHSTIGVTFDVYGHLFPDQQDLIAADLDAEYRSA